MYNVTVNSHVEIRGEKAMSSDKERERISELVIRLQNGESDAFGELYKLTSGRAYFVAFEITKNEQDAEDVLQESYIKMLEKIGTLDKPESFVSWFHHMVANKSKDSLKKRKPTLFEGGEDEAFEIIPDEDTSFSPEENLDQDELHRAVIEVIDELTEEKRACVMMMYFEEMSVNEISESLEIPVSTVKNRLFTARKDMKAKFEKRGITSLYSAAPIGVVIWAFSRTADAMSKSFAEGAASARVLSGITVSGTATAAAATTAAGTGTAATAAGAGIAAKVAALTATQKAIAGLVAVGVISGSAATAAVVVNNNKAENNITTTFVQEEVTTAPVYEFETVIPAAAVSETTTEDSETLQTLTETETTSRKTATANNITTAGVTETTKAVTTKKQKTTRAKTTKKPTTTRKVTTAKETTIEEETTTKPTTTRKEKTTKERTTEKETTTKKVTTTKPATTKATTTKATTQPTTAKPTTTAAPTTTTTTAPQPATVTVSVIDFDDSVADTLTIEVEAGTVLSHENLFTLVEQNGYTITSGFDGTGYEQTAEAGGSYAINAYL